ncbi:MAG: fimbria/pilus outer membrane usher protein [Deltaproteobacteria bacterium]|nr:fimbria/pilus outer membrane usher protein [Deltaproteobacteria bacterium]
MKRNEEFYIRTEDLYKMGVNEPKKNKFFEEYVSLREIEGVVWHINEKTSMLHIEFPPGLLSKKTIEVSPKRKKLPPEDSKSFFFNYGANVTRGNQVEKLVFPQELGIRFRDFLFLCSSVYENSEGVKSFKRTYTTFYLENPKKYETLAIGDGYFIGKALSSSFPFLGISYAKDYSFDPYFIKTTPFSYEGYAKYPSEVIVSLDGYLVKKEKLSPGTFSLTDIIGSTGRHNVEITLKDVFGREETIYLPFYVCESNLQKGLHDFSYNLGFLKKGEKYSDPVFSFIHRYGINKNLTAGLRGEWKHKLGNLGPGITISTLYGSFDINTSFSLWGRNQSYGLSTSYSFFTKNFGIDLNIAWIEKNYATVVQQWDKRGIFAASSLSFGKSEIGSFSLGYIRDEIRKIATLSGSYSRNLSKNVVLYINGLSSKEKKTAFLSLSYKFGEHFLTLGVREDNVRFKIQKKPPQAEGLSYYLEVNSEKRDTVIKPRLQYDSRYGIYSLVHENKALTISSSGSLLYAGGEFALSRPVYDGFLIVRVPNMEGVRIYKENNEIGKTEKDGKIAIASFPSRLISEIKVNDKDIPLDYSLSYYKKELSVPRKGGSLVDFIPKRVCAVTGRMRKIGGEPIELSEAILGHGEKEVKFLIGRGGEFYIEDLNPGTYRGEVIIGEKLYIFHLSIPDNSEPFIDIGEIIVWEK